jgi:hypothetical protein
MAMDQVKIHFCYFPVCKVSETDGCQPFGKSYDGDFMESNMIRVRTPLV